MKTKTTKPAQRKGVRVWCAGMASPLTFDNSNGWGINDQGILGIGVPSGRYNEAGQELNDTVAAFKDWQRVGYVKG